MRGIMDSTETVQWQCRIPLHKVGLYHGLIFGYHIVFRTLETVAPSKESTYDVGTDAP
jgi:hypothetical protein